MTVSHGERDDGVVRGRARGGGGAVRYDGYRTGSGVVRGMALWGEGAQAGMKGTVMGRGWSGSWREAQASRVSRISSPVSPVPTQVDASGLQHRLPPSPAYPPYPPSWRSCTRHAAPSLPPLPPRPPIYYPLSPRQVGSSKGQLAQLHPACSGIREDDDGLLPEWVIYHELVATSKPFLRQASVEKCGTAVSRASTSLEPLYVLGGFPLPPLPLNRSVRRRRSTSLPSCPR